jgi:RHS repeat-associated protein
MHCATMQRTSSQNRPPAGSDAESYSLAYALNLPVQIYSAKCAVSIKAPHSNANAINEILPAYDEGGLLKTVKAKLRGSANETDFVTGISYNPKGQRERIKYGNGATTKYEYDMNNFRLTKLLTTRSNGTDTLQDLNYVYDEMGNITAITDDSQQTIFFNGQVVNPSQTFEYDALYRLAKATGREHNSIGADSEPETEGYNPAQISPEDGSAMRQYERRWEYDKVGNILNLIHQANSNSWTRSYSYAADSNRLNSTEISNSIVSYTYNQHGSMASMPHLQAMDWDFAERLAHITRGNTEAYYNYDGSGERVRKVVEKNGIVETRLYLSGFEIFRKRINGTIDTERETLHIMDDVKRIALVETLTVDNGTAANSVTQRYQLSNNIESATLELDDTASIISYEEYYPYGDTSYQAGKNIAEVSQKRYRYTGKEKDEESGLYYMLARYYSGWLGRWTASDPMANELPHQSSYMYCSGNPISRIDPDGTFDIENGTVEKGDTLSEIAKQISKKCGKEISVEQIAADNGIKDPNKIYYDRDKINMSLYSSGKTKSNTAVLGGIKGGASGNIKINSPSDKILAKLDKLVVNESVSLKSLYKINEATQDRLKTPIFQPKSNDPTEYTDPINWCIGSIGGKSVNIPCEEYEHKNEEAFLNAQANALDNVSGSLGYTIAASICGINDPNMLLQFSQTASLAGSLTASLANALSGRPQIYTQNSNHYKINTLLHNNGQGNVNGQGHILKLLENKNLKKEVP